MLLYLIKCYFKTGLTMAVLLTLGLIIMYSNSNKIRDRVDRNVISYGTSHNAFYIAFFMAMFVAYPLAIVDMLKYILK